MQITCPLTTEASRRSENIKQIQLITIHGKTFRTCSLVKCSFRHVSMAVKSARRPCLATVISKHSPPASLSISIFCTFEHMRANVRIVKHDIGTQQLYIYTGVHVFKTLQLQYLAWVLIMTVHYFAYNSARSNFICT